MSRRTACGTAVCLALLAVVAPTLAPGQPKVDPLQEMTAKLDDAAVKINKMRQLKGKKIAAGEVRTPDNKTTELGALIGNLLAVALSNQGDLEVVNRSDVCQVARENKLWVSDQFDPQAAKKMGMFIPADFLVSGRVSIVDRVALVTLSVVETETLKSVPAPGPMQMPLNDALLKKGTVPVTGDGCEDQKEKAPTDVSGAAAKAAGGSPPSAVDPNRLEVKVWTNKKSFKIGEVISIGVRVNRDAYVTLVDLGTSGQVTVLYPNRFHSRNRVRGGEDVLIPPPDGGFALTVQGPEGLEQIRAIATEEPVSFTPSDFSNPNVAFRSLDRNQTRNISVEKTKVAPDKWAEDVIALEIRP